MSFSTNTRTSVASTPEGAATQSRRTNVTSTLTKVSSQESLMFGGKDDDDVRDSMVEIDYESRRILTALELAVIFEDCVDTLTALSNSVAAPALELRTASSILEDDFFNRPRFGGTHRSVLSTPASRPQTRFAKAMMIAISPLPMAASKLVTREETSLSVTHTAERMSSDGTPSKPKSEPDKLGAELLPTSDRKAERSDGSPAEGTPTSVGSRSGGERRRSSARDRTTDEVASEDRQRDYLLKQHYQSKIYKRTWQANKEMTIMNIDEMSKVAGIKRSNPAHKLQADMAAIKLMMADIFTELVQKGTHEALEETLLREREELNRLSVASKRLRHKRTYAKKLRSDIMETKQSKKSELQMLKLAEHQIEDQSQELRIRTEVEFIYNKNLMDAKIESSLKRSNMSPEECEKEIIRIETWMDIEDASHEAMMKYLDQRLKELTVLLEYWTETYETDKERLMADLEELKEERAETAAHKERLEEKIRLWMPIITDSRRVMRIQKMREDYLRRCNAAAVRIGARWRGYMVRAAIGKFAKKL